MSFISHSKRSFNYQNVGRNSLVDGADPHQLISILFDQAILKLDESVKHAENQNLPGMLQARARAATIINGLETSLDFERGGELAFTMARIYREACTRINSAARTDMADRLVSAREMISEIASAWKAISPQQRAAS